MTHCFPASVDAADTQDWVKEDLSLVCKHWLELRISPGQLSLTKPTRCHPPPFGPLSFCSGQSRTSMAPVENISNPQISSQLLPSQRSFELSRPSWPAVLCNLG